ncbi:hypothetical protein K474DRAFT_61437 [Panus rudis PR-1116 ss-1]|nr:hypothetical protein K474DRAFT_61437 [Panus rudis PR-1116 ss-1]
MCHWPRLDHVLSPLRALYSLGLKSPIDVLDINAHIPRSGQERDLPKLTQPILDSTPQALRIDTALTASFCEQLRVSLLESPQFSHLEYIFWTPLLSTQEHTALAETLIAMHHMTSLTFIHIQLNMDLPISEHMMSYSVTSFEL